MVVPKVLTALNKLINSAVDARVLTSLSGPTAVMGSFNLQFFMMRREHSSLQLAHRCLPEVRIVFRGTVACAGVRLSVLAGNILAAAGSAASCGLPGNDVLPKPESDPAPAEIHNRLREVFVAA